MKNVAFFFSAIATQHLKKQRGKQKPNEDHEDSDDTEEWRSQSTRGFIEPGLVGKSHVDHKQKDVSHC